jgi:biotin carboxyl carrier protein
MSSKTPTSAALTWKVSGTRFQMNESQSAWRFERRPGGWIIAERVLEEGHLERVRFQGWERRTQLQASLEGRNWAGEMILKTRGSASAGAGDADLTAQFPGKVRKLLVREGDRVEEGTPLLLLEAMKMEFSIKAPFSGTVKKLCVQEGQQLSPGQQLIDLAPLETDGGSPQ